MDDYAFTVNLDYLNGADKRLPKSCASLGLVFLRNAIIAETNKEQNRTEQISNNYHSTAYVAAQRTRTVFEAPLAC